MKSIRFRISIALAILGLGCVSFGEGEVVVLGEEGVSPEVQRSIDRGLAFLAKAQNEHGSWDLNHEVANTSAALLAFMIEGHVPGRGRYGKSMDQALEYLLRTSMRNKSGYICGDRGSGGMYEHGMATLALSEIWGQSKRTDVREALVKAVDVILRAQNKDGGWRYSPAPNDADLSVTVMQCVALNSARESGIQVPDTTIERAVKYVRSCHNAREGGFGYMPGGSSGFARSGAGVTALMMMGQRDSKEARMGLEWLRSLPDSATVDNVGASKYFYGHYYAIQAMFQGGDEYFQAWYPRIAGTLLKAQKADGSWPEADGAGWGTGLAVVILGMPNRYVPIHQR